MLIFFICLKNIIHLEKSRDEILDKTGSTIISVLVWVVMFSVLGIIFLIITCCMIRHRTKTLKQEVDKIPSNLLKVSPNDLGPIYKKASSMWNQRKQIAPIPERSRIAKGFFEDSIDHKVYNINSQICQTFSDLEKLIVQKQSDLNRKNYQTPKMYFDYLLEQNKFNLNQNIVDNYLDYYYQARFASHATNFNYEDYQRFLLIFGQMKESIEINQNPCTLR